MRSTGWSSGVWGGSANKVILLGATSPWLLCQLAPSRITTAWASAATWLLISLRWWFMAAVLQIGMISAAALHRDGNREDLRRQPRPERRRLCLLPPARLSAAAATQAHSRAAALSSGRRRARHL